jgi:hypothetical protein
MIHGHMNVTLTKKVFSKTGLPTKLNLRCRWMATAYTMVVVPMAHLPKMSCGKILLAPLSQLFYFFSDQHLSAVKNIYMYIYIYTSIYTRLAERLYMNYRCHQITLRVKHF